MRHVGQMEMRRVGFTAVVAWDTPWERQRGGRTGRGRRRTRCCLLYSIYCSGKVVSAVVLFPHISLFFLVFYSLFYQQVLPAAAERTTPCTIMGLPAGRPAGEEGSIYGGCQQLAGTARCLSGLFSFFQFNFY